jgi:hypothetical protein
MAKRRCCRRGAVKPRNPAVVKPQWIVRVCNIRSGSDVTSNMRGFLKLLAMTISVNWLLAECSSSYTYIDCFLHCQRQAEVTVQAFGWPLAYRVITTQIESSVIVDFRVISWIVDLAVISMILATGYFLPQEIRHRRAMAQAMQSLRLR